MHNWGGRRASLSRSSTLHLRRRRSQREDDRGGWPREEQAITRDLLSSKRILVTDGGSGLGKSMFRRFLELGAVAVVVCGRRHNVLEETATEVAKEFPKRMFSTR